MTNPNKPGKVRVVFDSAARYKWRSLSDQLLQRPEQTNSLLKVLTRFWVLPRFWQENIALVANILPMLHKVEVSDETVKHYDLYVCPEGT